MPRQPWDKKLRTMKKIDLDPAVSKATVKAADKAAKAPKPKAAAKSKVPEIDLSAPKKGKKGEVGHGLMILFAPSAIAPKKGKAKK
jgi:hypothetical protein